MGTVLYSGLFLSGGELPRLGGVAENPLHFLCGDLVSVGFEVNFDSVLSAVDDSLDIRNVLFLHGFLCGHDFFANCNSS